MSKSDVNSSAQITESEEDTPKPSSEGDLDTILAEADLPDSSRLISATAFLNYMRDCKRRYGSMYHGQKLLNVAAQRWRSMSPEHRARYRKPDYRPESSVGPIKEGNSSVLCTEQDAEHGAAAVPGGGPSGSSMGEDDCDMKRKMKRSCSKRKRRKSACGKRRRKKSACQKRKSRSAKKSCSKRRRKSRKPKCKKSGGGH